MITLSSGGQSVKNLDPNISFKEAARRMGIDEGEFATATTYTRDTGRLWRSDSAIVNLAIAQACRTVAVYYSAAQSLDQVRGAARRTARRAGYRIIDDKYVETFRQSYTQQADQIVSHMLAKYRKNVKPEKLRATYDKALAVAVENLKTLKLTKVNAFFARWHIRRRLKGDAVKDIDDAVVDQWKFGRKFSKNIHYITALSAQKYFKRVLARWGALGSQWFAAGVKLHPKLTVKADHEKPSGGHFSPAPVYRKFKKKPYESMFIHPVRSGDSFGGTVTVEVKTEAETTLFPRFLRGITRGTEIAAQRATDRIHHMLAAKWLNLFNV